MNYKKPLFSRIVVLQYFMKKIYDIDYLKKYNHFINYQLYKLHKLIN